MAAFDDSEFVSLGAAAVAALEPTRRACAVHSFRVSAQLLEAAADGLEAGDDLRASVFLDVYRLLMIDGLSACRPLVDRC